MAKKPRFDPSNEHHKEALTHFLTGLAGMYGVPMRVLKYHVEKEELTEVTEWVYLHTYFREIDLDMPACAFPPAGAKQHQKHLSTDENTPTFFTPPGGQREFAIRLKPTLEGISSHKLILIGGRAWGEELFPWKRTIEAYKQLKQQSSLKEPFRTSYAFRSVRLPVRNPEELSQIALEAKRLVELFLSHYLRGWYAKRFYELEHLAEDLYLWMKLSKPLQDLLKDYSETLPLGKGQFMLSLRSRRCRYEKGVALFAPVVGFTRVFPDRDQLTDEDWKRLNPNPNGYSKMHKWELERCLRYGEEPREGPLGYLVSFYDHRRVISRRFRDEDLEKRGEHLRKLIESTYRSIRHLCHIQQESTRETRIHRLRRRINALVIQPFYGEGLWGEEGLKKIIEGNEMRKILGVDRIELVKIPYLEMNDVGWSHEREKRIKEVIEGKTNIASLEKRIDNFPDVGTEPYWPKELYIPVVFHDRVTDVLVATCTKGILPEAEELLMHLAHGIAPRLEHARIIDTFSRFERIFPWMTYRKPNYTKLLEEICYIMSAGGAELWIENDEGLYECEAAVGTEIATKKIDPKVETSFLSLVVKGRSKMISLTNHFTETVKDYEHLRVQGFKYGLGIWVPLEVRRPERGQGFTIHMWSRYHAFTPEDAAILRGFALGVSGAVTLLRQEYLHRIEQDRNLIRVLHEVKAPSIALRSYSDYVREALDNYLRNPSRWGYLRPRIKLSLRKMRDIGRYVGVVSEHFSLFTTLLKEERIERERYDEGKKHLMWLGKTIEEALDILSFKAEERKIKASVISAPKGKGLNLPSSLPLRITERQRLALEVIIFNLLSNAYTYSERNSIVEIYIEQTPKGLYLLVANKGIGVPLGEEEAIFRRGVRGSNTVPVHPTGTGFGLWIARQAAKWLGERGNVVVHDPSPDHTVFRLVIPDDVISWEETKIIKGGKTP